MATGHALPGPRPGARRGEGSRSRRPVAAARARRPELVQPGRHRAAARVPRSDCLEEPFAPPVSALRRAAHCSACERRRAAPMLRRGGTAQDGAPSGESRRLSRGHWAAAPRGCRPDAGRQRRAAPDRAAARDDAERRPDGSAAQGAFKAGGGRGGGACAAARRVAARVAVQRASDRMGRRAHSPPPLVWTALARRPLPLCRRAAHIAPEESRAPSRAPPR